MQCAVLSISTSFLGRSHHAPFCLPPILAPHPAVMPGLLFRRPSQGATCQPHHTTAIPCLRFCNPHQIAACCMSQRSALHQPSQRAASVIAPHCVSPGRTQPSARNPTSRPRFPPSGVAGKPLPTPRLPHTDNKRPRCSAQNTTASRAWEPGPRPAQDRFPIRNALFPSWPAALWSHIVFV